MDSSFGFSTTRETLTVILPAWNEAATIRTIINQVLGLDVPNVEIQLIIVESNSSDGTRELVCEYSDHPRTQVLLQDRPRGKGSAVREGLAHAAGTIILIQDGDLEYRVEEYPLLLEPLMSGQSKFVLGNRHVPGRPIRQFGDRHFELISRLMNGAHWVLTNLFNLLYGVRLKDPMTMYKVFRRECIEGVEFVADRFDFDWELVAKLIRLGYEPMEVPVSYKARGYGHGKKVRFFRDPPNIIVAIFRFRFAKLRVQAQPKPDKLLFETAVADPSKNGYRADGQERSDANAKSSETKPEGGRTV